MPNSGTYHRNRVGKDASSKKNLRAIIEKCGKFLKQSTSLVTFFIFQPKIIIMAANIDGVIVMCQNSFKYFLYIDSLNLLNDIQNRLHY